MKIFYITFTRNKNIQPIKADTIQKAVKLAVKEYNDTWCDIYTEEDFEGFENYNKLSSIEVD